jgi:hypothetical protein
VSHRVAIRCFGCFDVIIIIVLVIIIATCVIVIDVVGNIRQVFAHFG